MFKSKTIPFIIYISFIIYEVSAIVFFDTVPDLKIFGISLFNFLSCLYIPFVIYGYINFLKLEKSKEIRTFFVVLLIYSLYQLFVLLPISIITYGFIRDVNYLSVIVIRSSFLLIPFIYWFLLRDDINLKIIENLINLASLVLFILGIYNLYSGNINKTNTGESRLLLGTATIFFSATLFQNSKFFGAQKNKIILIMISIIGLIFANHRSGYISIIIVIIVTFLLWSKKNQKKISYLISIIILILSFAAVLENSFLKDNFFARFSSSLDFNDVNYLDRALRNGLAFENFKENPINGTLLSGYYYKVGAISEYQNNWMPHNFIMETLSTQGLVGLLFILIILFFLIKNGVKNRNDNISESSLNILLYYIIFALANVTFLNLTTILIFCTYSAFILKRYN